MTNTHDLGMTDTEYTVLLTKGYDPQLERRLIEAGESTTFAAKVNPHCRTVPGQTAKDR